jgi:hypothetical protein
MRDTINNQKEKPKENKNKLSHLLSACLHSFVNKILVTQISTKAVYIHARHLRMVASGRVVFHFNNSMTRCFAFVGGETAAASHHEMTQHDFLLSADGPHPTCSVSNTISLPGAPRSPLVACTTVNRTQYV